MKKITMIFLTILTLYLCLYIYDSNYYKNTNLPIIDIKLNNTTLKKINTGTKKVKYKNNKVKIIDKKTTTDSITIKGRGNYTWKFPKKPYQIKFSKEKSILGFKKAKKYVLLANYLDPSLLKNDFTLRVASKMNIKYTNIGVFTDLYVDKKYIGNYYVTPKIMISEASVNLKNKNSILAELDNNYYEEENYFETNNFKDHIVIKETKGKKDMTTIFQNKYNEMEEYIEEKDYNNLKKTVDVESLAKYYIIAEFSSNFDALQSSFFMYQDGENDLIHIGPIWDYDVAYGEKTDYSDVNIFYIKDGITDPNATCIFNELLQMEEFQELVKEIWKKEASKAYKSEIKNLNNQILHIKESATMNNNYWKTNSFNRAESYFKEWLNKRYKIFDLYMGENK